MPATTTHDITINNVGYLIKPGSYRKRSAPLMGARFTTGDPDYSQLGPLQHWVQSCWIGGMGQEQWNDDAMFDEAVGVDSSLHERLSLTRDLIQPAGKGYGLDNLDILREFVVYKDQLFCVGFNATGDGKVYKYTASTDSWALFRTLTGSLIRTCAQWGKSLFIGSTANYLHRCVDTTWSTVAFPTNLGSGNNTPYAMEPYKDRLYVGFGNGQVWRLKSNMAWDGTAVFFDMPDSGYIVDFEVHLGFLYMLSSTGIIYRTDGNNTGEVWRGDGGTTGVAMRSYDGRLFVTLRQTDDGGSASEAAIYQMSGSSMTELKRWGKPTKWVVPSMRMVQLGGRLFYGAGGLLGMADGFGVAVYDAVEDGHSIFATSVDTATYAGGLNGTGWTVDDLYVFGGYLFVAVRDHGVFRTPMTFRDYAFGRESAKYDITTAGAFGGGWLKSSTYDAGTPGLEKLWTAVQLEYELPGSGTTIKLDYSLDGGRTWTSDAISLTYVSAGRKRHRQMLTNVKSTSLKWRVRLASTNSSYTPVLYSVNVSYLPLQDPQYQWEFTIVVSEEQELLDGTVSVNANTATTVAALETLYRANAPVTFKDVNGSTWTNGVIITDFFESVFSTSAPLEAEVRLTLLEILET